MDEITLEQEYLIKDQTESSSSLKKTVSSDYEKALSLIGLGKFHLLLLFVCGLANSSDAIEILCISFVLPSAACELKMISSDKGLLSSMTFLGMMIGGYIWGSIADVYGRKYVLSSALFFNAIFGILAGFSQTFKILLLFRFLSGLGVGGSVPIVWSYFSEFIPKNIRGRMICCLASSWLFGNLLVILFAYLILNKFNGFYINLFNGFININDWRMFMIISALPSALTCFLILFLPESPKFCLYNKKENEAKKILKMIYSMNHGSKNTENKKQAFDHFESFKVLYKISLSDDENYDDYRSNDKLPLYSNNLSLKLRLKYFYSASKQNVINIYNKTLGLFGKEYLINTIIILFVMFALCFGYYGLWIWLPELYKRMDQTGGSPCSSNLIPKNLTELSQNSSLCKIEDSVYISSFYSALSNLPGNLFTIIFIDKMGRNLLTAFSLILSGVSVFGIPFITNQNQGVLLATIFGGINVITFNSFGCTSTEVYPTKLRSSALGVQYVAGRMGAIFGNLLFGLLVDLNCYIPLLTISSLLILSGFLSFKLPESKNIDID